MDDARDPIAACRAFVHGGDFAAARAWCEWEARLCTRVADEAPIACLGARPTLALLETHYFARGPWSGIVSPASTLCATRRA